MLNNCYRIEVTNKQIPWNKYENYHRIILIIIIIIVVVKMVKMHQLGDFH